MRVVEVLSGKRAVLTGLSDVILRTVSCTIQLMMYFSLNRFILQARRVIFNVSLHAHIRPPLSGNTLIDNFVCRGMVFGSQPVQRLLQQPTPVLYPQKARVNFSK